MIDRIIGFSVRNKFVISIFVLGIIVWGIESASRLPLDAVPDITNNQVQIITRAPVLAPPEIEQYITFPIEIAMANLPGVIEIRSISRFGLSVITVVFEDDMDTYLARQLVMEQLQTVQEEIPQSFGNPEMAPISTGLGEIYQYLLRPAPGYDTVYSLMDLRTINDWIVRRNLAGIPGVIEINGWGGYLKQYEVAVNPQRMLSLGVTLPEIFEALEQNNANTGGSYIEKHHNMYFIRGLGTVSTLSDIENIVITERNGVPILIRDIGEVRYGYAPRYGAVTYNGKGEIVIGIVMMLKGENSNLVTQRVQERIEQIKKMLPEGVILEPFLDRSELVARTVRTVITNLTEGALIVIAVLLLLVGNVRAGLIVASVIPLSMLFALGMMRVFGVSANLMSLGAIDFGLIVDGAVIIVEYILLVLTQKAHLSLSRQELDQLVHQSAYRIYRSAFFGVLIILIVYLPVWSLVGIEGKMFRPMAQTVSFALLGALLLSLTYVPMISAAALRIRPRSKPTIADRIMGFLRRLYLPTLKFALRHRLTVLLIATTLFGISLFLFLRMGGEFIPTLEEGDLAMQMVLPPGTALSETIETSLRVQQLLLEHFPEIEYIVAKIGTAEIATDPMPLEVADMILNMKPKEEWVSAQSRTELFDKMEELLTTHIPGASFDFSQPIQLRFNELMTGIRQDIAVKIYGEDLDTLVSLANRIAAIIQQVPGAADIRVDQMLGLPQITVQYNRERLARYGISIDKLNRLVQTAFAGTTAGVVFENERRFDLVVRLAPEYRRDIQDVRNLVVPLPNGSTVPLSELATIEYQSGPMQIRRDAAKRYIAIGVNARGRDIESLVEEIQQQIEQKIALPAGYSVTFGGQFENLRAARARLAIAVPVALGLIFVLLYFTFHSVKLAVMIYTAIPLAAIGGVFSLLLRDMPFSISAGVGFIALFGIAVLNGIVLIAQFLRLQEEGVTDLHERIVQGALSRLRPVILTASVAALGFLPMATSTSAGAEVQRPLATVVIGGLITSTLLTLLVLPVLYSLFAEFRLANLWKRVKATGNAAVLLIMLGLTTNTIAAQQPQVRTITLEQALEIAEQRHPDFQIAALQVDQQQALLPSAFTLPPLEIGYYRVGQAGELLESEWSLRQMLPFPLAYNNRYAALQSRVQWQEIAAQLRRIELRKAVRTAYTELSFATDRLRLLQRLEQLGTAFFEAAQKRYQQGDSPLLEKLSAESALLFLQQEKQSAQIALYEAHQQLQQWLYTTDSLVISDSLFRFPSARFDTALWRTHPQLQLVTQQIRVAEAQKSLAISKYYPDLSIGYLDRTADGIAGYRGIELGVSLPLWFWSPASAVASTTIAIDIARQQYQKQQFQLHTQLQTAFSTFQQRKQQLKLYEQRGLTIAQALIHTAERSYQRGEIDYLQYLQLLLQALRLQEQYLNLLRQYNLSVVDLLFVLGQ